MIIPISLAEQDEFSATPNGWHMVQDVIGLYPPGTPFTFLTLIGDYSANSALAGTVSALLVDKALGKPNSVQWYYWDGEGVTPALPAGQKCFFLVPQGSVIPLPWGEGASQLPQWPFEKTMPPSKVKYKNKVKAVAKAKPVKKVQSSQNVYYYQGWAGKAVEKHMPAGFATSVGPISSLPDGYPFVDPDTGGWLLLDLSLSNNIKPAAVAGIPVPSNVHYCTGCKKWENPGGSTYILTPDHFAVVTAQAGGVTEKLGGTNAIPWNGLFAIPDEYEVKQVPLSAIPLNYPFFTENTSNPSKVWSFKNKKTGSHPYVFTAVPCKIVYCPSCNQWENEESSATSLPPWPYAEGNLTTAPSSNPNTEYEYHPVYNLILVADGVEFLKTWGSDPKTYVGQDNYLKSSKYYVMNDTMRKMSKGCPGIVRTAKKVAHA